MTIIGSFLSSVYSVVGLDVSSMVIGYFKYCTRKMMSSGFWNYQSTYCLSFFLNFLYWSLASICSALVPKTTLKSSNSPSKFRIDDVYDGQLN